MHFPVMLVQEYSAYNSFAGCLTMCALTELQHNVTARYPQVAAVVVVA